MNTTDRPVTIHRLDTTETYTVTAPNAWTAAERAFPGHVIESSQDSAVHVVTASGTIIATATYA